jgi:hypothetical protein
VHAAARKQRGVALLVILVALGLLVGMLAIGFAGDLLRQNQSQQRTTDALAQAREALIGWSVQRTSSVTLPNARPGELPCPDQNNDGFEDGTCVPGALGRVPWKTLGIPEPRDGAGETFWYALAGPFRIWAVNANQIDNDTKGNITVYSGSSSTVMTSEAVAVIFAPGAVLGAQDRGCTVGVNCTATGQCTTSPASLTPKCNPTNYLDTTGGANNATTNGPYISAQPSDTFNDRLLVITTDSLITPVEQRAAREMLALLDRYKTLSTCDCYPWAANNFDDDSVNLRTRGGVPIENALPENWGSLGITVPAWIIGSESGGKVVLRRRPQQTDAPTPGTLTVDGVAGTDVVLITPGPAGASRPSSNLPDYLDDAENSNSNDTFVTPSSTAYARDRIYVIP